MLLVHDRARQGLFSRLLDTKESGCSGRLTVAFLRRRWDRRRGTCRRPQRWAQQTAARPSGRDAVLMVLTASLVTA